MLATLLAKIFGTANIRQLKRLQPIVDQINALEPSMQALSDEELAQKTPYFKDLLEQGKTLDDILPEAFAVVRETARRILGQRHFDVQLIGGIVLHQGKIAEMKTGEGKTLTATLPLYLNALSGKGAHLVTVNDYLARRDGEWMKPVFEHLGLRLGILQNATPDRERKEIYEADIVYATNSELGFDYLRDNMKYRLSDYVQRELNFAIVDEVDSILIDEARTPLIISGMSDESSSLYEQADRVVSTMVKDVDYEAEEKTKRVLFTETGNDKLEKFFGVSNLYDPEHIKLVHHANQALQAHVMYKLDIDYVVKDGEVMIVDEFTGRLMPGRRYSDGLHQAIEAKEKVTIERESQTVASITLQNYFRLYTKLAGMTGTAATEAEEFHKIYKLDVVIIPTNRPMIRKDMPDLVFIGKEAKYKEIIEDVKKRHEKGQPVLIGTIAIETSEMLSNILTVSGVPHEVLNAKNHAREAEIVQHAGELGRVTIATNMAGRGTDIKLTQESLDVGGLYILGTERHESRRIDNQLRGRAGRQGDPGESRFYIALDDNLIRIFGGDDAKNRMQRVGQLIGMDQDEALEDPYLSKLIERSQEKVEKYNFDVRRNLIEYDDVLNQQRTVVYAIRREVLEGEEHIIDIARDMVAHMVSAIVAGYAPKRNVTHEEISQVLERLSQITSIPVEEFEGHKFHLAANSEALRIGLIDMLMKHIEDRFQAVDEDKRHMFHDAHKWIMLDTIDEAWKQHMLNLDHLKEGINLRSWGQKNPLIEYKREAFDMFEDMMRHVRMQVVNLIFHLRVEHFNSHELEQKRDKEMSQMHMVGPDDPEGDISVTQATSSKVGRNVDCPCGSGKKYKKCCGKDA